MKEEVGERIEKELINMLDDMQNNRGCSSKMALAPIDSQDPDLACRDNVCTYHVLNNTLCQS
jgi:hypothetical protein